MKKEYNKPTLETILTVDVLLTSGGAVNDGFFDLPEIDVGNFS